MDFFWAEPGDRAELGEFLARTFGLDSFQAAPDRCRWLYFDNPLGLHVSLCRAEGRIVAACGHLPQRVTLGERSLLAGFGIDFMVAPDWRLRGIGKRFLAMRLERFPLSLSIGQSQGMSSLYRSQGAVDLGPLSQAFHRRRPSTGSNLKITARNWAAWMAGRRRPGPRWPSVSEPFSPLAPGGPVVGPASSRPGLDLSEPWLSWRFAETPYRDYRYQILQSESEKRGIAISREEGQVLHLVHVDVPPGGRPRALAALAHSHPLEETRFVVCGDKWHRDCHDAGFLVRPLATRLVALTVDAGIRSLLEPGCLDLTAASADADLLRPPRAAESIQS